MDRIQHGGATKTITKRSTAFSCPTFQHHFNAIKTPYADATVISKDQHNQGWGGTCCNYGKEGRTYFWEKSGNICTFSTYLSGNVLLYDEVDSYGQGHIAECILIVAKYELSDAQVVDKEINAMAMLIELLGVIK